jgi:signal transduction histidine kinase
MSDEQHPSIEDLRRFSAFQDLEPPELEWLAAHFTTQDYENGETISEPGTLATDMIAIFEGEMQARRDTPTGESVYLAPAGTLTGKLPFSRMKQFPSVVRAVGHTRVGRLHEKHFQEMLHAIPVLGERLVGVLADRVREVAKIDYSRQKMAALGKLSAGLAHELNNPASAARRSAANLREALKQLADANLHLSTCPMTDAQREQLAQFEVEVAGRLDTQPVLDSLDQSDLEQNLIEWLDQHGVKNGWEIAATLVDTGLETHCLDDVLQMTGPKMLGSVLRRIAGTFAVERLLREIESSTERISELVRAVKEYSYMDRAQEQEIDLHRGLDTTLTMLSHDLKTGVKVTKEYDKKLPKIMANGGELNQVWTNLIDNAIDAMKGKGELRIRTAREADMALVEISDNGPGIAPEVQGRIFEPFFTTKGVGEGTGLGLELVYRIVGRHHGDVRFTSSPGHTVFQVRIPLVQPGAQRNEPVYAHQSNS